MAKTVTITHPTHGVKCRNNVTVFGLLLGIDGRVYNEGTGRRQLNGGGYGFLRMRCSGGFPSEHNLGLRREQINRSYLLKANVKMGWRGGQGCNVLRDGEFAVIGKSGPVGMFVTVILRRANRFP